MKGTWEVGKLEKNQPLKPRIPLRVVSGARGGGNAGGAGGNGECVAAGLHRLGKTVRKGDVMSREVRVRRRRRRREGEGRLGEGGMERNVDRYSKKVVARHESTRGERR